MSALNETTAPYIPDIRDLVKTNTFELLCRLNGDARAEPLTADELEALENASKAASNTHSSVLMGLRVVSEYLYLALRKAKAVSVLMINLNRGMDCTDAMKAVAEVLEDLLSVAEDRMRKLYELKAS